MTQTYTVEEYSQDTRSFEIISNIILPEEVIRDVYYECDFIKDVEYDLTDAVRAHDFWEDAKLPDDLKVTITFGGTEYGDDCQVEVYRHTEDGASVSFEGKGAEDVPDYGDKV
tara:strand:+ start:297 stop:635 length:339 start_codon:yes stop_codon:yes gene_type:complete